MPEDRERRRARGRVNDAKRRAGTPYLRWYKTKRWLALRAAQLRRKPLCERCEKRKKITPATVANHRVPHHGDPALFWDAANLESLCAPCHNSDAKATDARGYSNDLDPATGMPIDPMHPFNRG